MPSLHTEGMSGPRGPSLHIEGSWAVRQAASKGFPAQFRGGTVVAALTLITSCPVNLTAAT